jgi:hypothetical protein
MLVVGLDSDPRVFSCYVIAPYLPRYHVQASPAELHGALERAREAYVYLRSIPAPKRGEIIRQIRVALAAKVRDVHVS